MNEGIYNVNVTLSGGSGKAYIVSPAYITVTGGEMTARIEWSSPNYDLMIVGGEEYLPVNAEGNSVFEIPVYTLEEPLSVQAETTAMSEPHLIDYEIVFDAASLNAPGNAEAAAFAGGAMALAVSAAACVIVYIREKRKKRSR